MSKRRLLSVSAMRAPRAAGEGIVGLYRRLEARVGPVLPRPVRAVWRRLLGRPPLPEPRQWGARGVDEAEERRRVAEIVRTRRHPDVVLLPIIAWRFRHQRPQQLARAMAAQGRRVFWVDPAGLAERVAAEDVSPLFRVAPLDERIFEVELAAPRPLDQWRDALGVTDVATMARALDELRVEASIVSAIVVVQLPFWTPLALHLRYAFGWPVVYDWMDDHAGFSTNGPAMLAAEERLVAESDLVVVTSRSLEAAARGRARSLVLLPNACDFEHFALVDAAGRPPAELSGLRSPIIGYFGAISEWFDFDLVRHAARTHPDWTFVLIGSTFGAPSHDDLARAPNVLFLGEKPYDELPSYLARFDVATIPFRLTPLIEATSPVKFFEYLAAGKPVVASRLPELVPHAGLVELVDSPEDFTRALERALLDTSPERVAERRAFAARNTWSSRASVLLRHADDTFPLVTIVIVTWNNLSFTRDCLAALLDDHTWPRREVIVVDNASTDGTVEYLERLAERDAIRLLRNEENRGFAAANNQGIAAARGEYVVLLNNDTVVTPGWLPRLVDVLRRDPRVGLVGPVSDGTWNEARERIDRNELARLPEFAEAWARAHRGEVYPIRMLAMYCVAARRPVLEWVGPLDERFDVGMFEDDDYAHRMRLAGFRLACAEEVFIHHASQASFEKIENREAIYEGNRAKFEAKWGTTWRPYRGDRRQTRRWRDEVASLAARRAPGAAPVVVLGEPAAAEEGTAALALGRAIAQRGRLVFLHAEPDGVAHQGLVHAGERLIVASVPLEAFEDLSRPLVVATQPGDFPLAWFTGASRVVRLEAGWQERDAARVADEVLGVAPATGAA